MNPTASPVWTIRELLEWTEKYFRQKAIEHPRLEAQILLAHVLKCSRTSLYVRFDEVPDETQRAEFKALLRRRVEGCPVAYLVGYKEFFSLRFEVSPAVLIPRPETEHLIVEAIRLLKSLPQPRILDLGTGSGCIVVSLLKQLKSATAIATDISPDALEWAGKNATLHGVADRLQLLRGDLFAPLSAEECFDAIVSNPPYIDSREIDTLAPEVKNYEPRTALDGGPDGLAIYQRMIPSAWEHLSPGGWLLVEIGATQADAVRRLFEQAGFQQVRVEHDLAKLPRVVLGCKAMVTTSEVAGSGIVLADAGNASQHPTSRVNRGKAVVD